MCARDDAAALADLLHHRRNANELAETLRQLDIPPEWTHEIVRRKVLFDQAAFTKRCFSEPGGGAQGADGRRGRGAGPGARGRGRAALNPRYLPWRQRIAFVPDADLFKAVREGQASVVTDQIESFVEGGIQLQSGRTLDADVIVAATGFNLNVLGDIRFQVDGAPLDFARCIGWNGTMFTGLPNLAWVFGYFRASWTLRADLIAEFVCRLLQHMDARGAAVVEPRLRPQDEGMSLKPWVEPENFNPGYIQRGIHLLPRQGDRAPWLHTQDYWSEKELLPRADLDDGSLAYR